MYLLGLDIGSSSIKAALADARTGAVAGIVVLPDTEMEMHAPQPGWAEQDPEMWWEYCCLAVRRLLAKTGAAPDSVQAIGLAYQMHGLVTLDARGNTVRPAIIWCDSRAIAAGEAAFRELGESFCLEHYLNAPGNFTASKLKWLKEHEPTHYEQIRHFMLPGDYIAYRLSGDIRTTLPGLSEGILWDFKNNAPARQLLDLYGIDPALMPPLAPTFGLQGQLTKAAAASLGLQPGIPITYRAGDQPNNALALDVFDPGEVAATGGTSGVVYGVVDGFVSDPANRINSFAHVNHSAGAPRIGVLLCINGAGIQYGWMRKHVAHEGWMYPDMETLAATVPVGSDGLTILPFGNGAERMLGNRNPGAKILNLNFNRHQQAHLFRAALEGVAFAFVHGMQILRELGIDVSVIRVGDDNLFQSAIFSHTVANLVNCRIEMLHTTGAYGAAIASGVGIGLWPDARSGLGALRKVKAFEPDLKLIDQYQAAYERWAAFL